MFLCLGQEWQIYLLIIFFEQDLLAYIYVFIHLMRLMLESSIKHLVHFIAPGISFHMGNGKL